MKQKKTNAMRMLDTQKIPYKVFSYETHNQAFDDMDIDIASTIHQDQSLIFKTIVLQFQQQHFVAVVPLDKHIDMKKAAKALGVKRVELLHLNKLFDLTGYVRGGCSPLGMKKQFPTVIQEDAKELEYMHVSGGKLGMQIRLAPLDLQKVAKAEFADVIRP